MQIPAYINITNANVHDTHSMDDIPYDTNDYYIFDRCYFDLDRLYKINIINSYFFIRLKDQLQYMIIDGEDLFEGADRDFCNHTIELDGYQYRMKYPLDCVELYTTPIF